MSQPETPSSEPVYHGPKKQFPYLLVTFIALVLILGVAALFVPKAWTAYKTARAERVVAEADRLIEEGNPQEAFNLLSRSYSEHPHEPQYLRAIAKFLKKAGAEPDKSLHFWRQLSSSGQSTYDDKVELGITLTQSNDAGEARRIYDAFTAEEKQLPRSKELLAYVLMAEGQTTQAEQVLKEALASDRDNLESRFKLARIEIKNPFTEVQARAYEELWSLARGEGVISIAAIDLLANDPKLTAPQSKELMTLLKDHPRSTSRVYYAVLQHYLRLNPSEKVAIVEAEVARQQGQPYEGLFDFYRWLYLVGEHDHLVKLMPREVATKVREMFPIYMEVLASKNEWKTIQEILKNNPTLPASPTDLALLRARCAHGLNEGTEVIRAHFVDACRAALATRDMNNFNRTTQITERLGYEDVAVEAYRNASEIPQYKLAMLERIVKIHTKNRATVQAYETLKSIVASKPDAYDQREQVLYLSLLLGLDIERALVDNESLKSISARKTPPEFIEALVAYRYRDLDKLKALLGSISSSELSTGQRAVFAGLLAVSGQIAEGYNVAEKISPSLILEEEANFLRLAL